MLDITIGDFILAPRPRYIVIEKDYTPSLFSGGATSSAACASSGGCEGAIKNWEIILEVHCRGNGDLASARRNWLRLENFLKDVCNSNVVKFRRVYCDEEPLIHYITSGYIKPINLDWMPDCCDNTTLSGELHLITSEVNTGVELMAYDYHILKPVG